MRKFDLTFNERMFKFAINDLAKSINFAINEIKIIEIAFDELFIFIITINEYNNIIFFDCEYTTFLFITS